MIVLDFKANGRKVYKILRDYPAIEDKKPGIKFILEDNESKSKITFSYFLPEDKMINTYDWKGIKKGEYHFESAGIEGGSESQLIVETGFLKYKRNGILSKDKEITKTAKKYRFILSDK